MAKHRHTWSSEAKRLYRWAIKVGAVLAFLCHLIPPHSEYRAACNLLASLCGGH